MAQLSDDCFAHGGALMPLDDALARLGETLRPVTKRETVALAEASGRVLAADVISLVDLPPLDNSAVDGYAVFFDDLDANAETQLPVVGRVAAGQVLDRPGRRGEAIRIFTGAPMPDGPDTVLMQEDCREEDGTVAIAPGIARGANRRRAGEDIRAGEVALVRGRRLLPQDIGLAAATGHAELPVHAPLRVAVFSTGDEIREPGAALPPGAIWDANRYLLAAALRRLGCAVEDLGILGDDREAIAGALAGAAEAHDLILTSGGVSVGEEDHVKAAVEAHGSLHFWRLAIKPGRPVAMGQIGAVPFVGLPGNPAAALVTFLLVARPMVLRLSGADAPAPRRYRVAAGFDHKKKAGRREFVRARLSRGDDGAPVAEKSGSPGAAILSTVVGADGLVDLDADMTYLKTGETVDFLPFNEVLS
jgi:molybdopterin molybdotransferase